VRWWANKESNLEPAD